MVSSSKGRGSFGRETCFDNFKIANAKSYSSCHKIPFLSYKAREMINVLPTFTPTKQHCPGGCEVMVSGLRYVKLKGM